MWTSCSTMRATRRSRSVCEAVSMATAAARSQDSVLEPTSATTLYTLSVAVLVIAALPRVMLPYAPSAAGLSTAARPASQNAGSRTPCLVHPVLHQAAGLSDMHAVGHAVWRPGASHHRVLPGRRAEPRGAELRRPLQRFEIHVHEAEAVAVAGH